MKRILSLALTLPLTLLFAAGAHGETGVIQQIFSFPCPNTLSGVCADGYQPNVLIQASDGNFYGAAQLTTFGTSRKVAHSSKLHPVANSLCSLRSRRTATAII